MTTPAATSYALAFLEGSLGLVSGSLREEVVPKELVADLCSVMRGASAEDTETPSLETRIRDVLTEAEKDAIESRGYFVRKARWPGGAPFAVCLTHDVDNIERPKEHVEKVADRFAMEDIERWRKGKLSLYDNVEMIAQRERELGFRSSFYFMSAEYPLSKVRATAHKIHKEGWEIGLHGDFGTHDSAEAMRRAVARLTRGTGVRPRGVREHYLRFDFAKTWKIMEGARFDYDTTPGNADRLGFKLGLATPFHPPDERWRAMRLLELPLSLMDTTLWGYLKKEEEEGLNDIIRFMDMTKGVEGLFTLLWHQEAVRMRGGRIYWLVLEEVRKSGAFVGSGAEIARWWRAREVPLEAGKDGKLITLGGPPPKGLVIQLKVEAGREVRAPSARHRKRSRGGYHEHELLPLGPSFRLELRG